MFGSGLEPASPGSEARTQPTEPPNHLPFYLFQMLEYQTQPAEFEIKEEIIDDGNGDYTSGALAAQDGSSSSSGEHQQAVSKPKRNKPGRHECEQCGEMFQSLVRLRKHVKTHRVLNMICPKCERKHDFGCPYQKHKTREHCGKCCAGESTKERSYTKIKNNNFWCFVCNRKWASSFLLREHQKRAHNLQTPENDTGTGAGAGEEAGMNNANDNEVRTWILFRIR